MTDENDRYRRGRVQVAETVLRDLLGVPEDVIVTGLSVAPGHPTTLTVDIISERLGEVWPDREVPLLDPFHFLIKTHVVEGEPTYRRIEWRGPWGPNEEATRPWLVVTGGTDSVPFGELDQVYQDALDEGYPDTRVIYSSVGISVRKGGKAHV